MGSLKTWIDWSVLALCMAAAVAAVLVGGAHVMSTAWMRETREHAAVGVLGLVAVLAVVNCGFLIGAAVCKLRRDVRLGRR